VNGLTWFISDVYQCTTVVVRSTVTGHTEAMFKVSVHRSTMPQIDMIPQSL